MSANEGLKETIRLINSVSPSFCLAKWKQVTIHLHNGQTHSCHHPGTHAIPESELATNPSVLHNTEFKKLQRREMREGIRPKECHYCWNMEDVGPQVVSDRHLKSNDHWAKPHLNEVIAAPWDANVVPSYVEVSFSHKCNFKCLYCYPHISSLWESEIRTKGPIQLNKYAYNGLDAEKFQTIGRLAGDKNPYIDAFWKWIPDIYHELKILRVTGGEPLMSKNTTKLLQYVKEHPNQNLELAINSNLGVPGNVVKTFADDFAGATSKIKVLQLFTSLDTWGPQAEYIRTGLKLKLFQKNLQTLFEKIPNLKLTFMCTFNALSPFSFVDFLKQILNLKQTHGPQGANVFLDISYLQNPNFLSVLILDATHLPLFENALAFMKQNLEEPENGKFGFVEYEITKMERLIDYFKLKIVDQTYDKLGLRRDFCLFIREMDLRRKTHFVMTFPDLAKDVDTWFELKD